MKRTATTAMHMPDTRRRMAGTVIRSTITRAAAATTTSIATGTRGEDCCGHDHGHAHDHAHGCSCGHDHTHGCACGHDHSHGPEAPKWVFPAAVVLFALGLVFEHVLHLPVWAVAVSHGLAAILSGYGVFLDGLKNLVRLNFTENVLMSIAVIVAFCLGEFGEAAAVAILFNLGERAEESPERRSAGASRRVTESAAGHGARAPGRRRANRLPGLGRRGRNRRRQPV